METAIEIISGRHLDASSANPGEYLCPVCRTAVFLRTGEVRIPHFAHRADAPKYCVLHTGPGRHTAIQAMTSAVLQMQILVDRDELQIYLLDESNSGTVVTTLASKETRQVSRSRRDATNDDQIDPPVLPPLFGALIFVRRLGGAFYGHDHYTHPVHWGDELIVFAESDYLAPRRAGGKRLSMAQILGPKWRAWKITLPPSPTAEIKTWAALTGIRVSLRTDRLRFPCPPFAYGTEGLGYISDSPITVHTGSLPIELSAVNNVHLSANRKSLDSNTRYHLTLGSNVSQVTLYDGSSRVTKLAISATPDTWNPPQWRLEVDGVEINPSTGTHLIKTAPRRIQLRADSEITFTVAAIVGKNSKRRQLLDAGSAEATSWIQSLQGSAEQFTVTTPNLGAIVLQVGHRQRTDGASAINPGPVSNFIDSTRRADNTRHLQNWHNAYAAATARRPYSTMHWNTGSTRQSEKGYRK